MGTHIHHHYYGCGPGAGEIASIQNKLARLLGRIEKLETQEAQLMNDWTTFNATMDRIAQDVTNVANEVKTLQDELAAAIASGDPAQLEAAQAKMGAIATALEAIPPAVQAAAATAAPATEAAAPAAQPAS